MTTAPKRLACKAGDLAPANSFLAHAPVGANGVDRLDEAET
jgi:hypothetical protein